MRRGFGDRSNAPGEKCPDGVPLRNEKSARGRALSARVAWGRPHGSERIPQNRPVPERGSTRPAALTAFSTLVPGWVYGSAADQGIFRPPEQFCQAGRGRRRQKRRLPFCWSASSDGVPRFKSVLHRINAPADTELIPAALEQPHNDWGEPAAIV
jgi:hypothetical protein